MAVSLASFDRSTDGATSTAALAGANVALVVISDLEFGGAQRQVIELANHMDPARFDLHVVSLQDYVPLARSLNDAGRRLHLIPRRHRYDFTVVPRLARLIRQLGAGVVHGYLFDAEIATRLAGRLTGAAVIGSERNTNYTMKRSNRLAYRATRWGHDLTIANSNAGADFNSRLLGQPRSCYRVVHNGVDATRFQPANGAAVRAEWNIAPDERVVGMFASFKPQKNHSLLLRAARRVLSTHPRTRFVFVGDELFKGMSGSVDFKRSVEHLVNELGLAERCLFAGNRKDVERCYPACDLTVLPSLFEGTPNVALESMACGVPVVATDVSDNAYVIPDGRAGFIVPSNNDATLADRITRILADEPLRRRLGAEARTWILEEFTGARLADKTAAVYDEAIRLRRPARTPSVAPTTPTLASANSAVD